MAVQRRSKAERDKAAQIMKRVTVILEEGTHARLKSLCALHRIRLMEACRLAVEDYVEALEKRKAPPTRTRQPRAEPARVQGHQTAA